MGVCTSQTSTPPGRDTILQERTQDQPRGFIVDSSWVKYLDLIDKLVKTKQEVDRLLPEAQFDTDLKQRLQDLEKQSLILMVLCKRRFVKDHGFTFLLWPEAQRPRYCTGDFDTTVWEQKLVEPIQLTDISPSTRQVYEDVVGIEWDTWTAQASVP